RNYLEAREFIAPLVMDPTNPAVLYAGTTRVYRSADGAANWAAISPALGSTISSIGVSASAPNTVYAGTRSGHVRVTTNGGGDGFPDRSAGLPNRFITGIAV